MFEQKRLCCDRTCTAWAEQFRKGDQQVDGEEEEVAHGANRTMTTSARKTPPHRRIPSYYEFATHRIRVELVHTDVARGFIDFAAVQQRT